jgi:U3 small nucleolar RNA-associated protein 12
MLVGHCCPQVQQVRAGDLESALLMLPFTDALRLMTYLPVWLEQGAGEMSCVPLHVACLPLEIHYSWKVSDLCSIDPS